MNICTTTTDPMSVHWAATNLQQALQIYVCPLSKFDIVNITNISAESSCLGVGTSTAKLFQFHTSSFNISSVEEGYVMGPAPNDPTSYILTGDLRNSDNHQRGTLYATIDFLEDLGLRWLDSKTTVTTKDCPFEKDAVKALASLPPLKSYSPPLEYRQVLAWDIDQNSLFSSLSKNNGKARGVKQLYGGGTIYASPPGFVHTSYSLLDPKAGQVPPPKLYADHPEWFWGGPASYGQLCWSNQSLINYVINQSINYLQNQPDATVLSVSQNDNYNYCNTTAEQKMYAEEDGSRIGPILRAVNQVADAVAIAFPHRDVAIDTLAYQWTRAAPTKTYPRANVIIRLCSIECNFGAPLSDSTNSKFQTDIINWGHFSNRTWIWNYVTDYSNYVQPWPDYNNIQPNTKFYIEHGYVLCMMTVIVLVSVLLYKDLTVVHFQCAYIL